MPDFRPIYSDGSYLKENQGWHQEDSPYKAKLVSNAIARSGIKFRSCADVGCGAGLVTELVAKEFPSSTFKGFELVGRRPAVLGPAPAVGQSELRGRRSGRISGAV